MPTARSGVAAIGWCNVGVLILCVLLGACASSAGSPQQVRIAVAEQPSEQQRAFACAQSCEAFHPPGSGALFNCVRRCPGVELSDHDACTLSSSSHTICYGNQPGSGTIGPHDRDNAALLAIGLLRGLSDAHASVTTLRVRSP